MTAIPPAEKRPPYLRPPNISTGSQFPQGLASSRINGDGLLDIDERATKRRKVEGTDGQDQTLSPTQVAAEPPRVPPRYTNPQDLRLLAAVITANSASDHAKVDSKELPLMPTHTWKAKALKRSVESPKPTHRSRPNREVPCTPDTLTPPDDVPTLVNGRPAGYFPWGVRNHAEDQLSEINVKQGYYDRPPNPPEKELNTARVPLYNAFKHRAGVESLSTIFSIVLEAKHKHQLLSSASSFKPPPRVTLAEGKRRTWIAELADPHVPLRKLSRTIPQGIRGQSLLEQCLQNSVPLSRAIWFVKCVGANEIRTLKRKGTSQATAIGGERMWLRDWTISVEQFIESILSQSGQASWKTSLQYALRLTTRLYLENLIDRDHYLDWIVNTFDSVGNDRLPFWLMLAHVYKQDIAKFRKRGSKLAVSLVRRSLDLKDSTNVMVQAVVMKLRDAIRGFVLHRPQLFLLPDYWPETRPALAACLRKDNTLEQRLLQRLDYVNERSMGASKQQYLATPVPRDAIIEVLDATSTPFDTQTLSTKMLGASTDRSLLVQTCLEWGTTKFRCGRERVYLVSRLLRKWQKMGFLIDEAIIDFVAKCHGSPELFSATALKHLTAELSRSRSFPSSKYMQWLSVRGLPWPKSVSITEFADPEDPRQKYTKQTCKDETLLLTDLLFSEGESHHLNLRNALLSRAGFDTRREITDTHALQAKVRALFAKIGEDGYELARILKDAETLLDGWNWRVRSALSYSLRSVVVMKVKRQTVSQGSISLQKESPMTLTHFEFVRTCLETIGDDAVLADVVGLCSSVNNESLQAALAETISRHALSFSAIGALEPLQTRLCQNYVALRAIIPNMPLLAAALFDLCSTYPNKFGSVQMFTADRIRGDRGRAVSACSPFSDGVAESLQQAEATFIDDFEAVLQSEPSMNEQTMPRLFAVLVERIEKQSQSVDKELVFTYCQLMARLRLCRKTQGDQLLKTWLVKLLSRNPTGFAQILVSCLIATGAVDVDTLVDAFAGHRLAAPILQHMFPSMLPESRYSVVTKWTDFAIRKPDQLLALTSQLPRSAVSDFRSSELYVRAILQKDADLTKPARAQVKQMLGSFIGESKDGDASSGLEAMDTFSLPFVRLHLQLSTNTTSFSNEFSLADSIVNAANKGSVQNIAKLLQAAGPDIAGQVRQQLEDNIIEMLPSVSQGKLLDVSLDPERIERLQLAVDQAFLLFQPSAAPSSKNAAHLIEKLQQFLKFLGNSQQIAQISSPSAFLKQSVASPSTPSLGVQNFGGNLPPSSPMDIQSRPLPNTIVDYFRILLNLICLQRAPAKKTDAPPQVKTAAHSAENVRILAYVAHIATHPSFLLSRTTFPNSPQLQQRSREVVDYAYDVMATFVDDLTDEGRMLCAKILRDRIVDGPSGIPASGLALVKESQSRLRWLFGSVNAMGSDMPSAEELGQGLLVKRTVDGKAVNGEPKTVLSDWKPRTWEVLESQGRADGEVSLGLGIFGARRP